MTTPEPAFQEKIQAWKARATAEESNHTESENYYRQEIFPLVKETFITRARQQHIAPVHGLILPVGTSPEPIILSICALAPEKVLFLPTPQTLQHLDRIIEETGLRPTQYQYREIDGSNVLDIYRHIRDIVGQWQSLGSLGIDITAGKKVMSAAAAIAGATVEARLFYVDNTRFLRELRRPEPGTEFLAEIPDPLQVFGDLTDQEARQLFNSGDYEGAATRWKKLAEELADPRQAELHWLLSQMYGARDQLRFAEALKHSESLRQKAGQYQAAIAWPTPALHTALQVQHVQLERLDALTQPGKAARAKELATLELLQNTDKVYAMIGEFYSYAERRTARKQYSVATLIYYRIAELLAQRRLATHGIDTAAPDYGSLSPSLDELLSATNARRKELKMSQLAEMPDKISLMEAYLLLEALKDPFTDGVDLRSFKGMMSSRNESIFAHGFKFVDEKNLKKLRGEVFARLGAFWHAEGVDSEAADQMLESHSFLLLDEGV